MDGGVDMRPTGEMVMTRSPAFARNSKSPRGSGRVYSWAVVFLLGAGAASAGPVIVVADQTQEAIQAALDALGGPGTVLIPPGQYEIEGTLLIRTDGVTLQGSGADQTLLYRLTDGTNTSLVRSNSHRQVRITGISFEGVTSPDSNGVEVGIRLDSSVDFRVDNCFFTRLGRSGVWTNGSSSGVVDHCAFYDMYKPPVGTDGYGVEVGGIDMLEGEPFGSARATFIEDSTFQLCRHAVASNRAARYVFRYNYVTQDQIAHAVDAHGTEFGSMVGTEWVDVHDNWIDNPIFVTYAVRIRGGQGLVWNNVFIGYNEGIELTQDTTETTGPVYIWGNSISPDTSPMVRARGTMGTPTFALSPPDDYVPFPYPHPLTGAGAENR